MWMETRLIRSSSGSRPKKQEPEPWLTMSSGTSPNSCSINKAKSSADGALSPPLEIWRKKLESFYKKSLFEAFERYFKASGWPAEGSISSVLVIWFWTNEGFHETKVLDRKFWQTQRLSRSAKVFFNCSWNKDLEKIITPSFLEKKNIMIHDDNSLFCI